jgi:hypothetical protein
MNVSAELMQAILNYLAQQPYNEVVQLIGGIQAEAAKAAKAAEVAKVDKPDEDKAD